MRRKERKEKGGRENQLDGHIINMERGREGGKERETDGRKGGKSKK